MITRDIFNLHNAVTVVSETCDIETIKNLESHKVPYIGPSPFSFILFTDKNLTREALSRQGLNLPKGLVFKKGDYHIDCARKILNFINPPWFVRPSLKIANDFLELASEISKAFGDYEKIIIEEYIWGRGVECGIVENFRGQELYALPVVEEKIFCPAGFNLQTKRGIENMAKIAHNALHSRYYSSHDFIVSERPGKDKGKIYILDSKFYPLPQAQATKALEAIGVSYQDFLEHLVNLALEN